LTANREGDGLHVVKTDRGTSSHDYAWGPMGLLFESNATASTTCTPDFA
jgi:hypothetical protein